MKFRVFLVLIFLLIPTVSHACIISVHRKLEDVKLADVVVKGELISYERVGPGAKRSLANHALIKIRTLETWKGNEQAEWEFYWWNSTFGVPENWRGTRTIVIAGVRSGNKQPPLRGPSAYIRGTARPDLIQVLQAPCSQPFIFTATLDQHTLDREKRRYKTMHSNGKISSSSFLQKMDEHFKRLEQRQMERLGKLRKLLED